MKIQFPQTKVAHKRKEPRKPRFYQKSYFGTKGVVVSYNQAMAIYYEVQNFLDR